MSCVGDRCPPGVEGAVGGREGKTAGEETIFFEKATRQERNGVRRLCDQEGGGGRLSGSEACALRALSYRCWFRVVKRQMAWPANRGRRRETAAEVCDKCAKTHRRQVPPSYVCVDTEYAGAPRTLIPWFMHRDGSRAQHVETARVRQGKRKQGSMHAFAKKNMQLTLESRRPVI